MSMNWKYISNLEDNNLIDTIYCSHVELSIPIKYYWTVLMKDGVEYDINDEKLNEILVSDVDIEAFNKAKDNYMKL